MVLFLSALIAPGIARASDDPPVPSPAEAAVRALRSHDALRASRSLAHASDSGTRYWLGRSLEALELYDAAEHTYLEVTAQGATDPYFGSAVVRLADLADHTGDRSDLVAIAADAPIDSCPPEVRDELYYLRGLGRFERGALDEAMEAFGHVPEPSAWYPRARYVMAGIYRRQGKLKSAVRAYTDIARRSGEFETQAEVDAANRIRDLSLIEIARIYYGIHRYDQAATYLGYVPAGSEEWPRTVMDRAWCEFMLSQHRIEDDLALLETSVEPREYLPEAPILRALWFFNTMRYDQTDATLDRFEATWQPVYAELREATHGEPKPEDLYARYLCANPAPTTLPATLKAHLLRDTELAGLDRHIRETTEEDARIEAQPPAWRKVLASDLHAIVGSDRARLRDAAGRVLLAKLRGQADYLADLLLEAQVMRLESAQYRQKGGTPEAIPRLRALIALGPDAGSGSQGTSLATTMPEMLFRLAEETRADPPDAATIDLYRQVLQRYPDYERNDEVTWHLAIALADTKQPDAALAAATDLVHRWPASKLVPDASLLIGDAAFAAKRYADARDAYQPAADLTTHPQYAYANYRLALSLYALGAREVAIVRMKVAADTKSDPTLARIAAVDLRKMKAGTLR